MSLRWTWCPPSGRCQHAARPGHCEDASVWAGASGLESASQTRREKEPVKGCAEPWMFLHQAPSLSVSSETSPLVIRTTSQKPYPPMPQFLALQSRKQIAYFSRLSWGLNEFAHGKILSRGQRGQNYFDYNTKILFSFFCFHFLMSIPWSFPEANDMQYLNRLNAGAAMRIQLCSIKTDIKAICNNVKWDTLPTKYLLWKIQLFWISNVLLMYYEFVIILECISKYIKMSQLWLLIQSVLFYITHINKNFLVALIIFWA